MFARKYRLITFPRDRKSTYIKTPYFTLRIGRNQFPYSRIGIVISKKVDKRATVRNQLKRSFRAVLENERIHELGGLDLLFIFQPGIKDHVPDASQEALTIIKKQKV